MLYNFVLVSTIQQTNQPYICMDPSLLDFIQTPRVQSEELSAVQFSLVIYFTHRISSLYVSTPISQFLPIPEKIIIQKDTRISVFIAALFTINSQDMGAT